MRQKDKAFLGKGWAFPPRFYDSKRSTVTVTHEQDIRQSLHILLSTHPGERLMRPNYGCNLRQFVFENLTLTTITRMQELIRKSILFFEPRITVLNIEVMVDDYYDGRIDILIDYEVRLTNTRTNLVFPFYFKEATNAKMEGGL